MKIIDGDIHLSTEPGEGRITGEELISLMDENGVAKAVTWPMLSYTRQVAEDNQAIAESQRQYPKRIIGFGGINPRLGIEPSLDELEKCQQEYGFRGFKLNGARDEYYIDDQKLAYPFYERIAAFGGLLALHSGANDPARSHPWRVGKIAGDFPEMTILMVHMGGAGKPGLYRAAMEIAAEHDNIYLIGSEADPEAILEAVETLGAERVIYGSDCPFCRMDVELAMYETILADLPQHAKELIMGGNLKRLLALA